MKDYTYVQEMHLWRPRKGRTLAYTDGEEVEARLLDVVRNLSDKSLFSEELRKSIRDWPSEYHFSRSRHCLLRPLGIGVGDEVLELGCGCGALTRYLGENGARVISVEGSLQRAQIASERCRDLEHVDVVVDNLVNFSTEERFDWVLLIGVLEYAPLFAGMGEKAVHRYLEAASSLLKPDGKLVVAIENQLGLKYFNGCGEDHLGIPFFGVHDLYNRETPITFGRSELSSVLKSAGMEDVTFYYPWPDYKLPSVILHEKAFSENQIVLSDILMRCQSRDYMGNELRVFSEQLALPALERNNLLQDLANSFLVVASKYCGSNETPRAEVAWAYSCSSNRQRSLAVETVFQRRDDESEDLQVIKRRMAKENPDSVELQMGTQTVIHKCQPEPFYPGVIIARKILRARSKNPSLRELAEAFLPWLDTVLCHARHIADTPPEFLQNWLISGKYIDATPFNCISTRNGETVYFDREWEIADDIPLGWLLLRSIIWGWFGVTPWDGERGTLSAYNVLSAVCAQRTLAVTSDAVLEWFELEKRFQACIGDRPTGEVPRFFHTRQWSSFALVQEQHEHIGRLNGKLGSLQRQLAEVYSSSSWRYSKFLRNIGAASRKVQALRGKASMLWPPWQLVKKLRKIAVRDGLGGLRLRMKYAAAESIASKRPTAAKSALEVKKEKYQEWIHRFDTLDAELLSSMKAKAEKCVARPLISIVMPVYNPSLPLFREAVNSVLNQIYDSWELCIADDASTDSEVHRLLSEYRRLDKRISVKFRSKNGHISKASNTALECVRGEYVALMDQDDILPAHALYMVACAISRFPEGKLFYSDEDKIDLAGSRHMPSFKCDWNPDLFLSYNYFSHLGVYHTDLVRRVGGFRPGYEGAQDYDLALRCSEKVRDDQIVHIPHVLYHWRVVGGSTALTTAEKPYALLAGQKAISDCLRRNNIAAECEMKDNSYRVRYRLPSRLPLVSLVIPMENQAEMVAECIASICEHTAYGNFEIVIVQDQPRRSIPSAIPKNANGLQNIRIVDAKGLVAGDAHLYNSGVAEARGEIIGILHEDIRAVKPDWMDEMVSHACRPNRGAVGARLWYPGGVLQHGGVIVGIREGAGNAHRGTLRGFPGYRRRAELLQNFSAVSGACMFFEKRLFEAVSGFDEHILKYHLYDVDFCLKLRDHGFRNVWTPYAELHHHENGVLGNDNQMRPQPEILQEKRVFLRRWAVGKECDFAYSPNLTVQSEDFSLAWPPRMPLQDSRFLVS